MIDIAIIVPLVAPVARLRMSHAFCPEEWRGEGVPVLAWPEWDTRGFALLPSEVAALVSEWLTEPRKDGRRIILTRSEVAVLRVCRMIADGADIRATVHFPGSAYPPAIVDSTGEVDAWPNGLFSEDFEEVMAIRRAQQKAEEKNK